MNLLRYLILPLLGAAIVFYLFACLSLYFRQTGLVYVPGDRTIKATPADLKIEFEDLTLKTSDGLQIKGWFIPAKDARGAVLFCHGNAGNLSDLLQTVDFYHRNNIALLLFDYRGYGESDGSPSEPGTAIDALTAWNYLIDEEQFAPNQIILHGRSLGAAVAAELASELNRQEPTTRPAGIILESGFTSIRDIGAKLYPWLPVRTLSRYAYATIDKIDAFSDPILIAHSEEDELIPFSHAEELYRAAKEPKELFKFTGEHGDGFETTAEPYEETIISFIERAIRRAAAK